MNRRLLLVILAAALLIGASCTRKKKDNFSILKTSPTAQPTLIWQAEGGAEVKAWRSLYVRAVTLEGERKFRAADDIFESLNGKYALLNDFVYFHQAMIAKGTPDEARVMARLKRLLTKFPKSPLAPAAAYELARSALRANEKETARRYFEETRTAFPDTPQAAGASYYLGELLSGKDKIRAADLFRDYLKRAPSGTFARAAADGMSSLLGRDMKSPDHKLAGLAYYHVKNYDKALPHLEKSVDRDTWYPLAMCRMRMGRTAKAAEALKQGLKMGGRDDDVHQALRWIAAMMGGHRNAAWEEIGRRYPGYGDFALYNRTFPLTAERALPLFRKILDGWPRGSYAPEASWNVMWSHIRAGSMEEAYALGSVHLERYPRSKSAPGVLFWMAKILEKKSQPSDAADLYARVLKEYPDSYYAFRAKGRLAQIEDGAADPLWTCGDAGSFPSKWSPPPPLKLEEIAQRYGPSLAEVMHLGCWKDARTALEGRDDPLMEAYFKEWEGVFDEALIIVRDKVELKEPVEECPGWELLYPMVHCAKVGERARRFGVDPYLVQSIAREESYFNRKARSSADALGLMQLLPGTGRDMARWLNIPGFTPELLFNAEMNITLGSRYLRSVMDTFSGAPLFAVASYNAGPGAVARWRSSLPTDDLDAFMECIPYDQTRDYVKKVFRSRWNYTRIYAGRT